MKLDKTDRCIRVLDGVILYSAPKSNGVNTATEGIAHNPHEAPDKSPPVCFHFCATAMILDSFLACWSSAGKT